MRNIRLLTARDGKMYVALLNFSFVFYVLIVVSVIFFDCFYPVMGYLIYGCNIRKVKRRVLL